MKHGWKRKGDRKGKGMWSEGGIRKRRIYEYEVMIWWGKGMKRMEKEGG